MRAAVTCLGSKLLLALALVGVAPGEKQAMANAAGVGWYEGTVAAAFAAAQHEHKPLMLYWGAVWCPPCNELKSQVFTKPRFTELIKPLIAVALDGDSEQAQAWGERLHVGSYPTVLLLSPSGKELMRLPTAVSMAEFEAALTAGLASDHGFDESVTRALASKATAADWRLLAYYSWDEAWSYEHKELELLRLQAQLAELVPTALVTERALLTGAFLNSAASAAEGAAKDDKDAQKAALTAALVGYKATGLAWWDWLLSDRAALRGARVSVVYGLDILAWLYPNGSQGAAAADARWLAAVASLTPAPTDPTQAKLSVDLKLWAECAPLKLFLLRHPGEAVPNELKQQVLASAKAADAAAQTPYERHAVISSAAQLLLDAGEGGAARQLLTRELQRTDSPWYYQSAFARLERAEGHDAEALAWSKKARDSVRGRSSRLQWIASDLAMVAELKTWPGEQPTQEERLLESAQLYYDTALGLPDGFQGRSGRTAERVAKQLTPWVDKPAIRDVLSHYAKVCAGPQGPQGCAPHFAGLLPKGA